MERDFLGLKSKDSVVIVKEEFKDGGTDSAFMASSPGQWPFLQRPSALPQVMPFKVTPDERLRKMVFDPHSSSGFQPMLAMDAFDSNNRSSCGVVTQKCFNIERQGPQFAISAYPAQSIDAHGISAHPAHEIRRFPVSNHPFSAATNNPFLQIHGPNATTGSMMQQPLGGIPVTMPHSTVPIMGSMGGTFTPNPRNLSKPSATPAQLTIFYAGTVNVYDNIPPEKVQEIMFLAANGSAMTAKAANLKSQMQASAPKPSMGDAVHGNQSHVTSPCSGLSSSISVTSHTGAQSGTGSSNTDDLMALKSNGAPSSQVETPKAVTAISSATTAALMPAVPQARKASLARFLEKRKERVMNTAPYASGKKLQESPSGSDATGFSGK
ncbi:protein TIFY 6B-like isoform X2 [Tasmannia lanceolata]|uniref:protein TIFY 6B-like isoform X2 n=1 Tax=Tasmannia lanceolata TaxID=3420 RepID=UPI004062E9E1